MGAGDGAGVEARYTLEVIGVFVDWGRWAEAAPTASRLACTSSLSIPTSKTVLLTVKSSLSPFFHVLACSPRPPGPSAGHPRPVHALRCGCGCGAVGALRPGSGKERAAHLRRAGTVGNLSKRIRHRVHPRNARLARRGGGCIPVVRERKREGPRHRCSEARFVQGGVGPQGMSLVPHCSSSRFACARPWNEPVVRTHCTVDGVVTCNST